MPPERGTTTRGSPSRRRAQQGISPWVIFGFSLLVVFLVLAALYESWSLPFAVLLSTPVAISAPPGALASSRRVGVLPAPYMGEIENDVY